MSTASNSSNPKPGRSSGSFRRAILHGLGIVMPPLLTIVLFIWAWNAIDNYVLRPLESGIRGAIVLSMRGKILDAPPSDARPLQSGRLTDGFFHNGEPYVPGPAKQKFLPEEIKQYVDTRFDSLGPFQTPPISATAYLHHYVQLKYLPRLLTVPVFLLVFVVVLYFLGKLFAHGVGRMVVRSFEAIINRLPLISHVYGSVKQVTDFLFSERSIEFNRVVAVEYPRKGIWSLGFVTGQSMIEISDVAQEPVLSVLMPTSPMPMTGFTVTVRRSEAVDLDITIDQAINFIVSCGVVVPPHQLGQILKERGTPPQQHLE